MQEKKKASKRHSREITNSNTEIKDIKVKKRQKKEKEG